ncbi:XcbB/CpsF family capsular polysaccharide biosynthesis protein [Atlantibacter sp. RC6]|uniref:XcbB/CpsF family capsular polysaccharide biosynthesis protein n=1 Tax=Atlantibacter sp. RC6 TaxID=2587036 RepID=UPI001605FB43|nr:XcbB/CpsF family capsular polysaccharide biosynthesis protein [Atlantibacter sp. RC6]MBB3322573.1 hypothetical protein [Atlantibacter sp. RC6]
MSSVVLNIDFNIDYKKFCNLISFGHYRYVHINHSQLKDGNELNMVRLARSNKELLKKLVFLTNNKFYAYVLREGVTSFVHESALPNLWEPLKNKIYDIDSNGIVYQYTEATQTFDKKLLIVFSQISPEPHTASLSRYFPKSFSTIDKYVGKNVSILRVADIGGITGAFYLNTIAKPNNEEYIQALIKNICDKNEIHRENVLLYGASKGGTGALYHGLLGNYKVVSVDPVLNDEYYITNLDDFHMTENIFPESKFDKFSTLFNLKKRGETISDIKIITSKNSEQYSYILEAIAPINDKVFIISSLNNDIKKHPDVAPNSLHAITSLINLSLFDIQLKNEGIKYFI